MKSRLPAFILILSSVCLGAAQDKAAAIKWTDSTRDVYINGEIDRSAQVLFSEATRRVLLVSPKFDDAIVLDLASGVYTVLSKSSFRFTADRASAVSDDCSSGPPAGPFASVEESGYSFVAGDKAVLITKHKGITGELTESQIWETLPVWRSLMENYKPDAEAVAALKACPKQTTVTIALATWCPDSKLHVPRLIKALSAAANDKIRVRLIGIANKTQDRLSEPAGFITRYGISRVPTVIVERDEKEVGRITENPSAKTMEEDLAAILTRIN